MSALSANTEKRLRRRVVKSAIALLAVLSLVYSLVSAQETRKQPRPAKEQSGPTAAQQAKLTGKCGERLEHDTPPPVFITEGSCVVEVEMEKEDFDPAAIMGDKKRYKVQPLSGKNIFLAHVKILDGSGEMLYRFDNSKTAVEAKRFVTVTITLEDGKPNKEIDLFADGKDFFLETPRDKNLGKKSGDPSSDPCQGISARHRRRFRYMNARGEQRDIQSVKVTRGRDRKETLFSLDLSDLKLQGLELRVMIWWEEL